MVLRIRHTAVLVLGLVLVALLTACSGPQGKVESSGLWGVDGGIGKTGSQDERGPNNGQPFGNSVSVDVVKGDLNNDGDPQSPPGQPSDPPPDKPKHPRLDSTLNKLVGQIGSRSVADIASSAPISYGDLVAVTARLSHNSSSTVEFLESVGAIVANIGADYIEAYTPVIVLAPLSERDGVLRVETIIPPEPGVTDN
jgi:hypothetical protein